MLCKGKIILHKRLQSSVARETYCVQSRHFCGLKLITAVIKREKTITRVLGRFWLERSARNDIFFVKLHALSIRALLTNVRLANAPFWCLTV